jgi:cytochrome c oxidase assembly protein subunit 15
MRHTALLRAVALCACSLCLLVVVLGAYVRLSAAGLSCPDWPGCYGHFSPAGAAADMRVPGSAASAIANAQERPLEIGKAWREMLHRYGASTLGVLILALSAMTLLWRRERIAPAGLVLALLGVVVVQGLFGMLTVTWRLEPLIVTLHLLFGLTTLSLLWWLLLGLSSRRAASSRAGPVPFGSAMARARALAAVGLAALIVQIALGGWTSSNYAAIACPDFPTCQGSWWPAAHFRDAYTPGGPRDTAALVAIHLSHRLGALVASVALLLAALAALRQPQPALRRRALALLAALALQLTLGVSMVLHGFPLWLATAHNAGAALLLLATLWLNYSLRPERAAAARSVLT